MTETKKPEIVEAIQFDPEKKDWPKEVRAWNKIVPRDMSWGFVDTALGRINIQAGDWICKVSTGHILLLQDRVFKKLTLPTCLKN